MKDYSHAQVAEHFVEELDYNLSYDVERVEANANSYVVVVDKEHNVADAYDLSGYTVDKDEITAYIDANSSEIYLELDYEYDDKVQANYYKDRRTGIQFSKTRMTTSDSIKAQELIDHIKLKKATKLLTAKFGLSPKRAKEVAAYFLQIKNSNIATMTTYQYDQFSKAILGLSITDIKTALEDKQTENGRVLDSIYKKVAAVNGISKASVEKLANLLIK